MQKRPIEKIAFGASIFLAGNFLSKLLGYAYRLIVARIGTEEYGLLSIGIAVFGILTAISLFGMSESVTRFVSYYKGLNAEKKVKGTILSALSFVLIASLISTVFLMVSAGMFSSSIFHNQSLRLVLIFFAVAIPFDSLRNIFIGAIRAFQQIKYEVYAKSLAENSLKVALTLAVLAFGFGLVGAVIAYTISVIASFLLAFYYLQKKVFPIFSKLKPEYATGELLRFSWPLLFGGFAFLIIQWLDTIMIGFFKTASDAGIYNTALPTAQLLFMFPYALSVMFFPVITEMHAKKISFASIYRTITKWILLVNIMLLSLFILFSEKIIGYLFGDAYVADRVAFLFWSVPASSLSLIILGFGFFIVYLVMGSRDILMTYKKTRLLFWNMLAASVANVVLNFYLIQLYGIVGAAIATAVSFGLIGILTFIQATGLTGTVPFKPGYLKIVIATMFTFAIFYIGKGVAPITNVFNLVIACLVYLILYAAILFILKVFEEEDRVVIKALVGKLTG